MRRRPNTLLHTIWVAQDISEIMFERLGLDGGQEWVPFWSPYAEISAYTVYLVPIETACLRVGFLGDHGARCSVD